MNISIKCKTKNKNQKMNKFKKKIILIKNYRIKQNN